MNELEDRQEFGCQHCWPNEATAAWNTHSLLLRAKLIDESHFTVSIAACERCHQSFVRVFMELTDLQGGDDSQHWTLLPLSSTETADLMGRATAIQECDLNALGRERRSLNFSHPRGKDDLCYWGRGIYVLPHD